MSVVRRTLDATESLTKVDAPAAAMQQRLVRVVPDRVVPQLLGGAWLGHPVHPVLVLLPIGAWMSATVLDLMPGQQVAARRLVLTGLLGMAPAMVAGAVDYRELGTRQRRVGFVHAAANFTAGVCYAASYWSRRAGRTGSGRVWSTLGLAAIGAGGMLGGHLSYAQGVGVYRWQPQRAAHSAGAAEQPVAATAGAAEHA